MGNQGIPKSFFPHYLKLVEFMSLKAVQNALRNAPGKGEQLPFTQINELDQLFRVKKKNDFRDLLEIVYEIDVMQTLAQIMREEHLTLPEYVSGPQASLEIEEGYHPLLENPVPFCFSLKEDTNLCFLTGPNMGGKSTFLKSIGLVVYLAHLGFPVPAGKLRISLFKGLYTTINLADSLDLGYSHFYSEVRRVKEITKKIRSQEKVVVIFDELFRGTNVKDAYDASLMIISALSRIQECFFLISTHILEVAEKLNPQNHITFRCFESELIDQKLVYNYKLKEGVSKERIGMTIIKKEKIIEMLHEIIQDQEK